MLVGLEAHRSLVGVVEWSAPRESPLPRPIITKEYRRAYERLFKRALEASPDGSYDESALPSYTHPNPLMSWLFWRRIESALRLINDLEGKSVLDFGCGGAVTFRYLKELGARITGCDTDANELARHVCQELGIDAEIHQDLSKINGQEFDCILALDVLEHVENLDSTMDRLFDISHEKTRFVLSGPTESAAYRFGRFLAGFKGHYHVRNVYDVERIWEGKGLQRTQTRRLFPPTTLFRVSLWTRAPMA